jgi:hypothetical protein
MNWMAKMRPSGESRESRVGSVATPSKPTVSLANAGAQNLRSTNALKEFLWLLGDIPQARILDLGPIWQGTVNFFLEKGYRISSEDLLRGWKEFLNVEEESLRARPTGSWEDAAKPPSTTIIERFLETALQYPDESVHGILAWDLLDYFDADVVPYVTARLFRILHPGGAMMGLFHSRAVGSFHRYRIVNGQTIEQLAAPTLAVHAHIFQNREILDLFGEFRSSKTFVGRDQVREALFLK